MPTAAPNCVIPVSRPYGKRACNHKRRCVDYGKRHRDSFGSAREERWMSWATASRVRGAMTRTAVALALIGLAAAGATVPANATPGSGGMPGTPAPLQPATGPDDPACLAQPYLSECMGSNSLPPLSPTGPSDPQCISMPSDPVCAGGPYAPPPPPPPPNAAPTGLLDPACMTMPADAACTGSPYAPPPSPPPMAPSPLPMAPPPMMAPPPPPMAPPPMTGGGMPGGMGMPGHI
jgi:hypothetical protein